MQLYEALSMRVSAWREEHYKSDEFPAIAEILEWARQPEVPAFRLRAPQFRALETYWYLRLVENTPHILDLYGRLFPKVSERMTALGMNHADLREIVIDSGIEELIQRTRTDDEFVKKYRLETLRETLTLDYPSYILALAMGAGKTVLIGAIYATEFAMAQEYPENGFEENALVFAPGKTIIESLRELAEMHYEAILPPRMYKSFAATLKLTFTRDGDPDIPVTRGSSWNVVVTNTEKIRIQKETIRKSDMPTLFDLGKEDEAKAEIANLRLQAIASLPKLAIFSDEAHHTYGQAMDADLKKVRKTVDYLNNPHPEGSEQREVHETQLVCVVNTTGTPFFQRQPLRDVVVWYGLSEGIRDGILKEVAGNIYGIDFQGNEKEYLSFVVEDFFQAYSGVSLPDGTPAKLALFFPQTDDVTQLRPVIEGTLTKMGLSPTLILEHHTKHDSKADFDRFKSKDSPHRIALLVDRGVEGWNVPCLFACALVRQLRSSNNFVLQAASRCLRQIPDNTAKARIYLSLDNKGVLDRQLQETYGETFAQLLGGESRSRSAIITLRKIDLPPLVVKRTVRHVERVKKEIAPIRLERPASGPARGTVQAYTPSETGKLVQDSPVAVLYDTDSLDLYTSAQDLARTYRLDAFELLSELRRIYAEGQVIPAAHLPELARQVETQTAQYETVEETVEVALALVKKEGFDISADAQGNETYTAEISYPIDREHLIAQYEVWRQRAGRFGFHYTPYNFDSGPEQSFFETLLGMLRQKPDDVEDIYFTGALTDARKTDFFIEYRGVDGRMHNYTPDFVIRRKDSKCLIVEVKSERERDNEIDGEKGSKAVATRAWIGLNPEQLKYQMIFVKGDEIGFDDLGETKEFLDEQ
jgi:type III restriction enzyme